MSRKLKLLCVFLLSLFVAGLMIGDSSVEAAESVVKIGFLGPITGSDAAEGAAARNAFMLAISEANKSGEFPFKIEVIEVDDQSTENVAVAGAQEIVSESGVVAASGFWNSGPAAASIPVFKEAEIPLLIWGAIRESLTNEENVPYITRSAPTDKQENIPLAIKVLDEMAYKDWFIVSDVSSYGSGNFNAFKAELSARKITPLGEEQVPEDTTDLNAVVQKIKASGAKAVYCGSTVAIGSQLKRQLFEGGVKDILFCGISGMKTEDFLKIGAESAEGTLVVSPGVILEDTPEGSNFIKLYNSQGYSEPIGAFTPYAYEAALIIINALRACGEKPTAEAMVKAILDSKTTGIMGTTTFNKIGQTENVAAYLNVVQDGKWVPLEKSEYRQGGKLTFGGR
ncbi:MAG: branched-chain amino acid ABC transporter substrate-binding protein [Synergistaceae bacterium]|jgi:branched-chain amino acid transport system substrate-binding protein|nr:branched-chain amino acid ABC transporter substrate-binding protein [Synergistaceae bacterium]